MRGTAAHEQVRAELQGLTGMAPLKAFLTQLEAKVEYVARGGDPRLLEGCLNIVLTGNPGAGKTTAARLLARWLRAHGLLEERPLAAALLGGAVGGAMRGCLETPAELVKTRLQLQSAWSLPLLLRGLSSTVFRNAAMIGLFWAAFEASAPLRSRLPPLAASFVGGGGCSVLAWAAAFPLDTAKSCIQAGGGSTSVVAQLGRIYSERGIAG
mmetsp:Transcript_45032/g.145202  ORF Transcript_45032/g.145202 Transcript_45032/m.145202 type:complete len:211 (+) Transcript_45032:708-1340(+)